MSPLPPGVFRREGEYWTLEYGDTTCRLRDTVGMRHLAELLARPGEKMAASTLIETPPRGSARRPIGRRHSVAAAAAAERTRARVTRAVRAAMARIARHHAPLGEHLGATIRTGAYCSYVPDPRIAPVWRL
jgi:hypothetical protein